MLDELNVRGFWWIPGRKKYKAPGTLTFSQQDGPKLSLLGSLDGTSALDAFANRTFTENHKTLFGFSDNGKAITLINCQLYTKTINIPGIPSFEAIVDYIFVGKHFRHIEETIFKNMRVQYSGLDNWLNKTGFTINFDNMSKGKVSTYYKKPKDIRINLESGLSLNINTALAPVSLSVPQKEVRLVQKAYARFESRKHLSFEALLGYSHHFQNFLILATRAPCFPLQLTLLHKSKSEISVYYRINANTSHSREVKPFEMLFDYSLISRNFRRSITTWYLKREAIGLYFSTLRGNSMYSENKFLNLIQGLEAYHRQFVRNQEFPKAKYEKRKSRVLKDLPVSLKQWVSSNLGNEPSLHSRVTELVAGKKSLLSRLVPDTDRFINTVVETRRYYTHYGQTKKRNVAKPHELIHLIRPLTTLFEAVLLEELGLPKKKLDEIFTRRRRFQR